MKRRKILWKVLPYYLAIIGIALGLTAWYASVEMRRLYVAEVTQTLKARARIAGWQFAPFLADDGAGELNRQCRKLGDLSDTRLTVVNRDGAVLADSDEDFAGMENHGSRPEIRQAFAEGIGVATRHSNTLQKTMLYVAVPIVSGNDKVAVVRAAHAVTDVGQALSQFYNRIVISGIVVLLLATVGSFIAFRRLSRPLQELQQGAERFAKGEFDMKLTVPDSEEIAALAESMNYMSRQLDHRISQIVRQRNEREAIFANMSEGVVALDAQDRIAALNLAASDILNMRSDQAVGKSVFEAIRIPVLHDLINRASKSLDVPEALISLPGDPERQLQVHATELRDREGSRSGVILVLNDISRLRKLENMRRDFVANVSHELKTPITAITASVETLLAGAMENVGDTRRFLEMVARHAERLNALAEDLLSLARLENESERGEMHLERARLCTMIESAVQLCQESAKHHGVKIKVDCPTDLEIECNPRLLEQAVTNLIDNAIKHSDEGTTVTVSSSMTPEEITIMVEDHGTGIEAKHLPRLFERFYRIDTGRSRNVGGTGLGLAIVKHIAIAHGGRVSVDSMPGQGSTFCVHLRRTKD